MPTADDGTPKHYAMERGSVLDNADPLGDGRVRVEVPGYIAPPGLWAEPAAAPGSGTAHRGAFAPPDVGAAVYVMFIGGDIDSPIYFTGGFPTGTAPGPVGGYVRPLDTGMPGTPEEISAEEAHLVKAFESDAWAIVVDDRPGKERLALEMKKNGTRVVLGGGGARLEISAVELLSIKCDGTLRIDANTLVFNGRPVLPGAKPFLWPTIPRSRSPIRTRTTSAKRW